MKKILISLIFVFFLSSCIQIKTNYNKELKELGYIDIASINKENIPYIIEYNLPYDDYIKFSVIPGFDIKKIGTYLEVYKTTPITYNHQLVVNMVNMPDFMTKNYTFGKEAINQDNELILVNKNFYISRDFVPTKLITVPSEYVILTERVVHIKDIVLDHFIDLYNDAKKNNYTFFIYSGYRDFKYQESLYEKNNDELTTAKAGHSEHQTGYTIDISTKELGLTSYLGESNAGKWLKNNAYKYGFIIRYPESKEDLTGFSYEPWHIRYVGLEHAKKIYEENLILEEYLLKYFTY